MSLQFTHRERFHVTKGQKGQTYAPLTLGCPGNIILVERAEFKKTPEEKKLLKELKSSLPKTRNYKFQTITHFTT